MLSLLALNQSEKLQTECGHDRHIYCEGSREHVLTFSSNGVSCSHRNCIVNQTRDYNPSDWIFIKPKVNSMKVFTGYKERNGLYNY